MLQKQDLIDHPEKFRPYIYSTSTDFSISYEKFAEYGLKYHHFSDGRPPVIRTDANNHIVIRDKDKLVQDLVYMRKTYPSLYDEMAKKSDLPDIFPKVEEQYIKENPDGNNQSANPSRKNTGTGGKTKGHSVPITITQDQVNAEINYTHISESSDLKL